nr:MAG TPA: hypothetical protein [Caudoviricetes sp.]
MQEAVALRYGFLVLELKRGGASRNTSSKTPQK